MLSLFAFGLQSPPKGATIPYRPKAMSAGAHAVLAPQHSAQVSIHTVVIPVLLSTLYKRRNSAKASLSGNRREIELIKGGSPLEGYIFVSLCCLLPTPYSSKLFTLRWREQRDCNDTEESISPCFNGCNASESSA